MISAVGASLLLLAGCQDSPSQQNGGAAPAPVSHNTVSQDATPSPAPMPPPTLTVATSHLRRGSVLSVGVGSCAHGKTADFGVFLHDSLELATHPVDQSGLLHPHVTWRGNDGNSGVANLVIGKHGRTGRALLTLVCSNGTASRDLTVAR